MADPLLAVGNASSYFVPEEGLTIISDIDDILRVTKIYQPEEGLQNSFANNYTAWMNMPDIYQMWKNISGGSASSFCRHILIYLCSGVHFHYLTTTPEQVTRAYEAFTYANYPPGSFDDRFLNFTTLEQTLQIRKFRLQEVIESFPKRKFVLVADTSNGGQWRRAGSVENRD